MKQPYLEANCNTMAKKIIINIGRQFGCHGRDIARELGKELGIPVYDHELIDKAAQESGLSPIVFEKRDEKRRLFSSGIDDAELFRYQSLAIRKIAQEGSAIFVGRASNYILRDMDCCLDVFICAPLEIRSKCVSSREGVPSKDAQDYTFKQDSRRAHYYNFFSDGHWGKSSDYDLCLDSSKLGIQGCVKMIIEFGKLAGLID